MRFFVNITDATTGDFYVSIAQYSNIKGTTAIGSGFPVYQHGATTGGWVEVNATVGPAGTGADVDWDGSCLSFRIYTTWYEDGIATVDAIKARNIINIIYLGVFFFFFCH